ncbi:MAG: hypothetical protein VW438_03860, partial [Euryarchaeota archaeon]
SADPESWQRDVLKIAAILHEAGDSQKAMAAWRDVLDVDPEHLVARRRYEESREKVQPGPQYLETQD